MIAKYSKMLPLSPKAFGFEDIELAVVYHTNKRQFFVWGLPVFSVLTKSQRK